MNPRPRLQTPTSRMAREIAEIRADLQRIAVRLESVDRQIDGLHCEASSIHTDIDAELSRVDKYLKSFD